jgi:hypothetical protein
LLHLMAIWGLEYVVAYLQQCSRRRRANESSFVCAAMTANELRRIMTLALTKQKDTREQNWRTTKVPTFASGARGGQMW